MGAFVRPRAHARARERDGNRGVQLARSSHSIGGSRSRFRAPIFGTWLPSLLPLAIVPPLGAGHRSGHVYGHGLTTGATWTPTTGAKLRSVYRSLPAGRRLDAFVSLCYAHAFRLLTG